MCWRCSALDKGCRWYARAAKGKAISKARSHLATDVGAEEFDCNRDGFAPIDTYKKECAR